MDAFLAVLTTVLKAFFAVGAIGCLLVIPLTAMQLFKVLFEKDSEEEMRGGEIPTPEHS